MLFLHFIASLIAAIFATARPAQQTKIYNDAFVRASHLEQKAFVTKYKPTLLTKQKVLNQHDPTQVDYVLTYAVGPDKFTFYQTPTRSFITSFTAASDRLTLAGGVRIGMSKASFAKAFKRKSVANMVTVAETEQFELYTFVFSQNALSRISYQCRID